MKGAIHIGHLIKSFGKDGYMRMSLQDGINKGKITLSYMLIDVNGELLPYFIEDIDMELELVKFDEIHSPDDGRKLSDSKIFILKKDLPTKVSSLLSKEDVALLEGWEIVDQQSIVVGKVTEVVIMPMQILLKMDRNGHEFFIPFHESLIIKVEEEESRLHMEIADGLQDL